jgi:flavodoxin I
MKKTGLFYSFRSRKTRSIALKISEMMGPDKIEQVDAENINTDDFTRFDKMILGVPTWFDGELPVYWDEFVPAIREMDLTGKKIAVFGLADQVGYPENFGDAVGIMTELLRGRNAEIVGETSAEGYHFESSRAFHDGKFSGLVLDQENQGRMTDQRLKSWISAVKNGFE